MGIEPTSDALQVLLAPLEHATPFLAGRGGIEPPRNSIQSRAHHRSASPSKNSAGNSLDAAGSAFRHSGVWRGLLHPDR